LTGKLTIQDVHYGTHRARLVEPEPEDNAEPDDDAEPLYVYDCEHCEESFSSAPILRRHTWMQHATHAADAEEDAREQLEAAKEVKAARERIKRADPSELHPAERRLEDESSGPQRPSLWPSGLSGR
jgi:hypothetical protein